MENLIKKHADKIRFMIVGVVNTAIDFAILFALFNFFGMPIFFSNVLSTSVALAFSFFANKKFTFQDTNKNTKTKIAIFLTITLFGLWIIQPIIIAITNLFLVQTTDDTNVVLLVGKLIATCVTLVWNYLLYRKFVFNKTKKQSEQS